MNLTLTFLFTTADWINSIAAIAALLTAIITLITVTEIKKQREHSYHPDINIANFEFYVYRYDKDEEDADEEDNSIYIYYSKKRLSASDPKKGYNELTIDINNIGLAVAKGVYWYWESDIFEICNSFEEEGNPFLDWVIIERDLFIKNEKLNVDWIYSIDEENSGGYFNFILPYSIENRKNTIRLPSYFLDLYWLYKAKEVLEDFQDNSQEYPPIQLHIGYTNIHGKEIKKMFLLYLRWSFIGNPLRVDSELANFRLEIIEAQ